MGESDVCGGLLVQWSEPVPGSQQPLSANPALF